MFKVGDILKGNTDCVDNELIRTGLLKGKVLEVIDNGANLVIEVLEHLNPYNVGICFIESNSSTIFELLDNNEGLDNNEDKEKIKLDDVVCLLNNFNSYEINNKKDELDRVIRSKNEKRREFARLIRQEEELRLRIEELKVSDNLKTEIANKVLDELKAIEKDSKCKEVTIEDGTIKIFTTQLYIEDEENPEGHFKMNEYEIVINLDNLSVRVYGVLDEYNRESCWSDECPHPHISDSGRPCWGNTEAMLVDSMSNKELYTTFMLVINFLETFNIDDSAGKQIKNWDFVSKEDDNEILDNPYYHGTIVGDCGCEVDDEDELHACTVCDYTMCDECYYTCDDCGDTLCSEHREYLELYEKSICQSCLDRNYNYLDYKEQYVHDNDAIRCDLCDELFDEDDEQKLTAKDGKYSLSLCPNCLQDYPYICDECGDAIEEGQETDITSEGITVCKDCLDTSFIFIENLNEYIRDEDCFECDICHNNFFKDEACYPSLHNDNHLVYCEDCYNQSYPNLCEECKRGIKAGHETYIDYDDEFICEECKDNKYVYAKDLNNYVLKDKSFKCDLCNEIFSTDAINSYKNEDETTVRCCNNCYSSIINKESHNC